METKALTVIMEVMEQKISKFDDDFQLEHTDIKYDMLL